MPFIVNIKWSSFTAKLFANYFNFNETMAYGLFYHFSFNDCYNVWSLQTEDAKTNEERMSKCSPIFAPF